MKRYKKYIAVALVGMVMGLSACGNSKDIIENNLNEEVSEELKDIKIGEKHPDQKETEEVVTEATTEAPVAAEPDPEIQLNLYSMDLKEWQMAYKKKLDELRAERSASTEEMGQFISSYALDDFDKCGIPELIVRKGTCEADYMFDIYKYENEGANLLGSIGAGHTQLYTNPSESGFIACWGHMGYMSIAKVCYVDGNFSFDNVMEEDINDDPEKSYTPVSEVINGSVSISEYGYDVDLPLVATEKTIVTASPEYPLNDDEVKKIFDEVMNNERNVYASDVEFFERKIGSMSFDELRKKGNLYQYMSTDEMVVDSYEYVDLNQDGQLECWIRMVEVGEESMDNVSYVALSSQRGNVYAYVMNYLGYSYQSIGADGVIHGEYGDERLVFYKEQGFLRYE